MYWISKYSSSGSWNGEAVRLGLSLREAKTYLKDLAVARIDKGYDASLSTDGKRLDLSHDDLADAWTYTIEREAK